MTKSTENLDLDLKLRFRRLFFLAGYWTPVEVELSTYDETSRRQLSRRPLTDLDVLGIKYTENFSRHIVVGDCKSGSGGSEVSRLFWVSGVCKYFGADEAYLVKTRLDSHIRTVAPKIGVRLLDADALRQLEDAEGIKGQAEYLLDSDLWVKTALPKVPRDDSPRSAALRDLRSYLAYSYWYIEPHRRIFVLIDKISHAAEFLRSDDDVSQGLFFACVERFAHCAVDAAHYVAAQGFHDIPRNVRRYLYGGPLAMKEKQALFQLLAEVTSTKQELDPSWLVNYLEYVNRMVRHRFGAKDVLRYASVLYVWRVVLKQDDPVGMAGIDVNHESLVLAKDSARLLISICGLQQNMMDPLKNF